MERKLGKSLRVRLGRLEVIYGPMFSGKTDELLRRLTAADSAGRSVAAFKPAIDERHGRSSIVSHSGASRAATVVSASEHLLGAALGFDFVGVDESQFFDQGLVSAAGNLAAAGATVVLAGLDLDFRRQPFGSMRVLIAQADQVTRLEAVCTRCGCPATLTQRFSGPRPAAIEEPTISLGSRGLYEPRCEECWVQERSEVVGTNR